MCVHVPPIIIVCLWVFVCLSVLSLSKKLTRQEDQNSFLTLLCLIRKFVELLLLKKFVKSVLATWLFNPYGFTELFKQRKLIKASVLFASKTNVSR